jgi:hypothetical protein
MKTLSISLYNRPKYTKILLDHLAECYDINQYLIFIYCEPVNEEVISLAKQFRPNQTIVKINSERFGCNKNIYQCLDAGFNINDFHIHLEDDTIPGKDFLIYCQYLGNVYKNDQNIFSISGYVNCNNSNMDKLFVEPSESYDVYSYRNWFTPWGWATWSDRWPIIKSAFEESINKDSSWDFFVHSKLQDKLEIFPLVSRIQNIGADNGTYCPNAGWHRNNQYNEYWIETIQKYTTFYIKK